MIGVYAGVSVKPEHVEEFLKTIEPLVTASRQDEGNVSYDFGAVSDTDFAFIERWESQELLEKHMGTEHFQKAVAAWEPLLSSELDVRHRQLPLNDVKDRGARHPLSEGCRAPSYVSHGGIPSLGGERGY